MVIGPRLLTLCWRTSRWCSSLRLMGRQGREGVTRRRGTPSELAAQAGGWFATNFYPEDTGGDDMGGR